MNYVIKGVNESNEIFFLAAKGYNLAGAQYYYWTPDLSKAIFYDSTKECKKALESTYIKDSYVFSKTITSVKFFVTIMKIEFKKVSKTKILNLSCI